MKLGALLLCAVVFAQDAAMLEGTVVNAVTGAPEKRVTVSAAAYGVPTVPVSAVTDREGRFSFAALQPGTYLVRAHATQYDHLVRGAIAMQYTTMAAGDRKSITMKLTPTGAISGRVLDEDGEPVAYCSLQAFTRRKLGTSSSAASVTDDRGYYRLSKLPAGSYYVLLTPRPALTVRRPLLPIDTQMPPPPEAYASMFYPSSGDLAGATALPVGPGADVEGIDFELRKVRTVRVSGSIVAADESPKWSVTLDAVDGSVRFNTETAGGQFVIHGVPPRSYHLWVSTWQSLGSLPLEVGDRDLDGLVVQAERGIQIPGRVRTEGSAMPGSVLLLPLGRIVVPRSIQPARFGADGNFVLTNVLPGRHHVQVQTGAPVYVKSATLGGQPVQPHNMEVFPGVLDIVVGMNFGSVSGTIEGGGPFGVLVAGQERYRTMSGANGSWKVDQAPPGKYRVFYFADCFDDCLNDIEVPATGGEPLTVDEGGSHTVQLRAATP